MVLVGKYTIRGSYGMSEKKFRKIIGPGVGNPSAVGCSAGTLNNDQYMEKQFPSKISK